MFRILGLTILRLVLKTNLIDRFRMMADAKILRFSNEMEVDFIVTRIGPSFFSLPSSSWYKSQTDSVFP